MTECANSFSVPRRAHRTPAIFARAVIAIALLAALVPRAAALDPIDLIPAECLLCWYGRPLPDTTPVSEQPSSLQALLDLGTRLVGQPLDNRGQLLVRCAEMFSAWVRYPHALALVDARARSIQADSDTKRVDQLRFVLAVKSGADTDAFLRIIQKAVNEQTDAAAATLTRRSAASWSFQELRDKRLPEWCVLAWGQIGENFVFTIGSDMWPAVAAIAAGQAAGLSRERWYAEARAARAPTALIEIFVAMGAIRERLDPFVDGRATEFFRVWESHELEQAYWALGFQGRALYCEAHFRQGERTTTRLFADPDASDPHLLATIPPTARYAIYKVPMSRLFPRLIESVLETRGPEERAKIRQTWERIQKESGIDAQRDLLRHLGDRIVLHNDPPHPLRLPLAMTTLTEIRSEPRTVRRTVELACSKLREATHRGSDEGSPPLLTFEREDDGIWYLRFGLLAGPAWTVTDRFVITSWSPAALRAYLAKIGDAVGK